MDPATEKTLRALVAVTWADGRVEQEEKEILDSLIDAYGIHEDDANAIREWAATKKTLDEIDLEGLEEPDRVAILLQSVFVTYVDGVQSDKEVELLRDLGKRLGFAEKRIEDLIRVGSERAKAQYERDKAEAS